MEANSLHSSGMENSREQVFGVARNPTEEERREAPAELVLFHGIVHNNNEAPNEVSTTLNLLDESWAWPPLEDEEPDNKPAEESSKVASRIARMKHYSYREVREERLRGVSTMLTLFLDPWKIKKRLTQSDLGHLCRLLLQTTLVEKYIVPFMNLHQMTWIQSNRGMKVLVRDQDTNSEHNMLLKKWTTSKSYVFIDGWSQEFVNRRQLREGDEIGLYWDPYYSRFNFRVLSRP